MNRLFLSTPFLLPQGMAVIRIITGLFMAYHGWEVFDSSTMQGYAAWDQFRGTHFAVLMVYLGKGSELVAGVLLCMGLLTRVAAGILIITMLYISFFVGHGKIWYDDQHPFLFVLLGFVFVFTGPGSWSADGAITNHQKSFTYER